MKKAIVLSLLSLAVVFQFCHSSRKAAGKQPVKFTYISNVQPVMIASCSPCHMPPGGNKKPYNTYAAVKSDIDEIITRIQKNPGERGFMPQRHPKLSDSTIQVFVQWRNDGLLEK